MIEEENNELAVIIRAIIIGAIIGNIGDIHDLRTYK
jgi:hypothetical protein